MDNISIDIMASHVYKKITKNYNSFIHNVDYTKEGLKSNKGDDAQAKFIADSLKNGKYCKWSNMRGKDKKYFGNLEEIMTEECRRYGL